MNKDTCELIEVMENKTISPHHCPNGQRPISENITMKEAITQEQRQLGKHLDKYLGSEYRQAE